MPKYDNFDLDLQVEQASANRDFPPYEEKTLSLHITDGNIMTCCL